MDEIKNILKRVEALRKYLEKLIEDENQILSPEVIAASKMLDAVLNEYDKVIKAK